MSKQTITAMCATAAASTVIGFGFGSAGRPPAADAAGSNADVVKQLKVMDSHLRQMSRKLDDVNAKLGTTQGSQGSVRGLLTTICNYTAPVDCG
jgi:hypothetical protein